MRKWIKQRGVRGEMIKTIRDSLSPTCHSRCENARTRDLRALLPLQLQPSPPRIKVLCTAPRNHARPQKVCMTTLEKSRTPPPPHTHPYHNNSESPSPQISEATKIEAVFVLLFSKGSVFIACNSNGQEASVTPSVVTVSGNIAQSVRCLFCNHDLGFIL